VLLRQLDRDVTVGGDPAANRASTAARPRRPLARQRRGAQRIRGREVEQFFARVVAHDRASSRKARSPSRSFIIARRHVSDGAERLGESLGDFDCDNPAK
jgi:hypothetical protein